MMAIGRPVTIFVILITVYSAKTDSGYRLPGPRNKPFVNIFVSKPPDTIRTITTMRPHDLPTFPQISLYDFTFNFSNVGLRKIGPDFIISDKVISLNLDNNEISDISPLAFREIRKLKFLNLSGNRIPTEELLLLGKVDELQTLFINNNNPMDSRKRRNNINNSRKLVIDYRVFKSLKYLHACNSQLKDFQILDSTMPALTHLFLSNNSIESSDIIFDNMPNTLTDLSLDNNLIDRVGKYKLRNLQLLIMDNNFITEVCFENCQEQSISLKDASNMKILSLSKNRISNVSVDAFKDTKLLTYLDLSGNNIAEVIKDTFNNSLRIKYLSLADNKLTTIPKDICSLKYLMTLNLTGNHISAVHANNFCHFTYLENLYLANNTITVIGSQTFRDLRALKYLDLSENQLQQLPQQWAYIHLEELHLEKNNFEELDDIKLVDMINMKNVYLYENPMLSLKAASFASLPRHLTVHIKSIKNTKITNEDDYSDEDY